MLPPNVREESWGMVIVNEPVPNFSIGKFPKVDALTPFEVQFHATVLVPTSTLMALELDAEI